MKRTPEQERDWEAEAQDKADTYFEQQAIEADRRKRVMMVNVNGEQRIDPEYCPHKNTVLNTSGGWHFSAGDVWDDIHEEVYCRDCGTTLEDDPHTPNPDLPELDF